MFLPPSQEINLDLEVHLSAEQTSLNIQQNVALAGRDNVKNFYAISASTGND